MRKPEIAATREMVHVTLKLISNMEGLGNVSVDGLDMVFQRYPIFPSVFQRAVVAFIRSYRYDFIVLNCPPADIYLLAILKFLMPFNRCKLVSVDCVLSVPDGIQGRLKAALKSVAFKKVSMFVEYFRDTSGYTKYYRIHPDKFRYVPFKINQYNLVVNTCTDDQGYIFSGGVTRRDYVTLIEAMRGLNYPVKIVTGNDLELLKNCSSLNLDDIPTNIEVIRHDGNQESFNQYIAGSRLVVLPIKAKNISASGLSVYLQAMALRKCVIISAGPSVDGILSDDMAIMVPPERPDFLRDAIRKVFEDQEYRRRFEQNGYRYAMSLRDENRLYEAIVDKLMQDIRCRLHPR